MSNNSLTTRGLFLVLALIGGCCLANEPLWTPEQRAAKRQVVVDGHLTSIEKVRNQENPNLELMKARLKISSVGKGKELLENAGEVVVYYESSPLGPGYRCPSLADLRVGVRGKFYLRFDEGLLIKEKSLLLEMGSDFSPMAGKSADILPQVQKALETEPTFERLTQILGESDFDIGSAHYDIVYRLDQGSLIVKTKDKKSLIGVDYNGQQLYPVEAARKAD